MALSAPVVPIMVVSDLCKGVINLWVLGRAGGVFAGVVAFGVLPGGLSLCILLVGLDHTGWDENTLQFVHHQLNALGQKQLL